MSLDSRSQRANRQKYSVVTPVRDEAAHIRHTVESMLQQSLPPRQWIVVDDGSSDGTGEILDGYARKIDWLRVVHRADRGFRSAGGGVIDAFYAGYAFLDDDWDFVVKLDGDVSFAADYFEKALANFDAEPQLGIGGGLVCRQENGTLKVDSATDPPFHVRGATKIYRRRCWDQIAPLAIAPGWDTIDEVKANFHGWHTRTFRELHLIQHKPTGSADGNWRNWFKNGRANYVTGYHPLFLLAKCGRRAFSRRPFLMESTALFAGFTSGYLRRIPRGADTDVVRYLRRQQLRRLSGRPSIYA